MKTPQPPEHLSDESRRWYAGIIGDYELESHHIMLLQAAAECWDRTQQARAAVDSDGLTFKDRHGNLRPHPGLQVERDNRTLFARLVREMALDVVEPGDENRPPRITGNSGRKAN